MPPPTLNSEEPAKPYVERSHCRRAPNGAPQLVFHRSRLSRRGDRLVFLRWDSATQLARLVVFLLSVAVPSIPRDRHCGVHSPSQGSSRARGATRNGTLSIPYSGSCASLLLHFRNRSRTNLPHRRASTSSPDRARDHSYSLRIPPIGNIFHAVRQQSVASLLYSPRPIHRVLARSYGDSPAHRQLPDAYPVGSTPPH